MCVCRIVTPCFVELTCTHDDGKLRSRSCRYVCKRYFDLSKAWLTFSLQCFTIAAVKVPTFVVNACRRILNEVSTIGIFRKTGSSNRQKQIIVSICFCSSLIRFNTWHNFVKRRFSSANHLMVLRWCVVNGETYRWLSGSNRPRLLRATNNSITNWIGVAARPTDRLIHSNYFWELMRLSPLFLSRLNSSVVFHLMNQTMWLTLHVYLRHFFAVYPRL